MTQGYGGRLRRASTPDTSDEDYRSWLLSLSQPYVRKSATPPKILEECITLTVTRLYNSLFDLIVTSAHSYTPYSPRVYRWSIFQYCPDQWCTATKTVQRPWPPPQGYKYSICPSNPQWINQSSGFPDICSLPLNIPSTKILSASICPAQLLSPVQSSAQWTWLPWGCKHQDCSWWPP